MATQGFGCMGLSAFYSSARTTTPDSARAVIRHAIGKGVTLLNTATFYGELNENGYGHNLRLLKYALEGLERSKIELMVKIGMDTRCPVEKTGTSWVMSGDAVSLMTDVDYALQQLGSDYLDIIVLCRVPRDVPIEECMRGMKAIIDAGKAKRIGLSEASAATIQRAHAIHPLHCIEQEWSLWSRDVEAEIVPLCRSLGIKIVAYSPLGRGFLTGTIEEREDPCFDAEDFRVRMMPKFAEGNFEVNRKLVEAATAIAQKRGCTMGQLALAWLHAQGSDVIPIPGTSNPQHFDENYAALGISLSSEELAAIDDIFSVEASAGLRYPGNHNTFHEN